MKKVWSQQDDDLQNEIDKWSAATKETTQEAKGNMMEFFYWSTRMQREKKEMQRPDGKEREGTVRSEDFKLNIEYY